MDDTAKPKPVEKNPEAKELNESELEKVTGGAVNAYLIIDGRPGPSTSKTNAIKDLTIDP
jgi:bacteriocin-like protein